MRTVLIASLRRHTRRYVAATVAIVIGVAFIVVTSALSSAARNGMVSGLDAPFRNADVAVSDIDGAEALELLDRAEREGAAATVLAWAWLPVSKGADQLSDGTDVGAIADEPALRWQELTGGRFPANDVEAVVDTNAAKEYDVVIGDVLAIGPGSTPHEVTVVGMVDSPSAMVRTSLYLTEHQLRTWLDQASVNSVVWAGDGSPAKQISSLEASLPDATVQTADEFVDEQHAMVTQGVDVIAMVLLLFAAIALLTSTMVIANTFSILFAQRSKDFALLRCVGATRQQVLRSIRLEALALGIGASLLGLLIGTGLGFGIVELVQSLAPSARLGAAEPSLPWHAGAFATGLAITLAAAWLPTRRAVQVSPLAALRPDTGIDARTTAGRVQLGLGVTLVALGALALAGAMAGSNVMLMVLGGAATSIGVVVLGPTIVPALIRALTRSAGRLIGPAGRLAAGNAVRNPRRTAATTASLLVGVTLTTAVLTGLATSRSTVAHEMDVDHPLDVALTSSGVALDADVAAAAGRVPGVQEAVEVPGALAEIKGIGELRLLAPGPDAVATLRHDAPFATPRDNAIHLPYSALVDGNVPDKVTVTIGDASRTLRVSVGEGWGEAAVVSASTLAALTDDLSTQAVWLRTDLSADAEDLEGDLSAIAGDAEMTTELQKRAYVDLQIDVLTGAILGLLGIAVIIALVGIANTLGLSVLERTRENALLRALGLTRAQLRATLAGEAVLLSVVATLIGTALGVTFAWVGVETMLGEFVEEMPLDVPVGQLALVIVLAGAAGLLACILPARRAARVTPAAGLSLD